MAISSDASYIAVMSLVSKDGINSNLLYILKNDQNCNIHLEYTFGTNFSNGGISQMVFDRSSMFLYFVSFNLVTY